MQSEPSMAQSTRTVEDDFSRASPESGQRAVSRVFSLHLFPYDPLPFQRGRGRGAPQATSLLPLFRTNRTHIFPLPRTNRTHISPPPRTDRTHMSPVSSVAQTRSPPGDHVGWTYCASAPASLPAAESKATLVRRWGVGGRGRGGPGRRAQKEDARGGLARTQRVRSVRGAGCGLSDQYGLWVQQRCSRGSHRCSPSRG